MGWSALAAGALSAWGANRANKQSIELANTGYQRAMADMRKGGLNPILAGKYGPAATPTMQNIGSAAVEGYTGVTQAHSAKNLQSSQAKLADAQAEGQEISNLIKKLKELPEAKVKGFIPRLASQFTDWVDGIVSEFGMASGASDEVKNELLKVMLEARSVSMDTLLGMIRGGTHMTKEVKGLVAEVFSENEELVESVRGVIKPRSGKLSAEQWRQSQRKNPGIAQQIYNFIFGD